MASLRSRKIEIRKIETGEIAKGKRNSDGSGSRQWRCSRPVDAESHAATRAPGWRILLAERVLPGLLRAARGLDSIPCLHSSGKDIGDLCRARSSNECGKQDEAGISRRAERRDVSARHHLRYVRLCIVVYDLERRRVLQDAGLFQGADRVGADVHGSDDHREIAANHFHSVSVGGGDFHRIFAKGSVTSPARRRHRRNLFQSQRSCVRHRAVPPVLFRVSAENAKPSAQAGLGRWNAGDVYRAVSDCLASRIYRPDGHRCSVLMDFWDQGAALAALVLGFAVGGRLKDRILDMSGNDLQNGVDVRAFDSYEQRRYLIVKSLEGIAHYPQGIGLANFEVYSGTWREVHVAYLQIAVEGGIVALVLYLLFFARGFAN